MVMVWVMLRLMEEVTPLLPTELILTASPVMAGAWAMIGAWVMAGAGAMAGAWAMAGVWEEEDGSSKSVCQFCQQTSCFLMMSLLAE